MPTEIRKILFIRSDRMGDVLMNLPAVRRLRQNFPKAWITWMVDRSVAPLLRGQADVDEILEIDAVKLRDSAYRAQLTRQVRAVRYDAGVVSNAGKFFHWMLFRAGIPVRAGWRRKWGFFLNRSLRDEKARSARHEIDSNLELAGLIAPKPWDGSWSLPVDPKAGEAIEKRLRAECPGPLPVVAVHPGSSHPGKRWAPANFSTVCRSLAGKAKILFIGGSEEEVLSRELACGVEGSLDWTGALALGELSALLHSPRVRTLLSSDSGPVHVAWLHGKPVVALYAKDLPGSDPVRWGPRSPGSVAIHKRMNEISAAEVTSALEGLLAR